LGTIDPIFVRKKIFDAMSALENNPKINAAIKFIDAGLQLCGNNFALYP